MGWGGIVWVKETVSWLSRSSSVVLTAVPSRKCWLRGEWVVNLTLSLSRSHQARKHVDGTPKTIAHHHPSYSGICGSIKTTLSTCESHYTHQIKGWGPVHNNNRRFLSVNINLAINIYVLWRKNISPNSNSNHFIVKSSFNSLTNCETGQVHLL